MRFQRGTWQGIPGDSYYVVYRGALQDCLQNWDKDGGAEAEKNLVDVRGFEPLTLALQTRCSPS